MIVRVGPTDVRSIEHGDMASTWRDVAGVNNRVQGLDDGSNWEVNEPVEEKNGKVGNLKFFKRFLEGIEEGGSPSSGFIRKPLLLW